MRIRLTSIVSWSRLKITNLEVREAFIGLIRVFIYSIGLSRLRVLSIIYVINKETLLLTKRAMI